MSREILWKAVAMWGVLLVIAFLARLFREIVLVPRVGEQEGHVVSVLILVVAVLLCAHVLVNKSLKVYRAIDLFLIGGLWALLTALSKFLFGYYVQDLSWPKMIDDYNVAAGRVWIAVILTELIAPWFVGSVESPERRT